MTSVKEYINCKKCERCGAKVIAADPVYPELCNTCVSRLGDSDYNKRFREIIRELKK